MRNTMLGWVAIVLLGGSLLPLQAQEEKCKALDMEAGRRFLPDRVPMEADTIQVDRNNLAALEFSDKSRVAVAALQASGLSGEMRQKYQFVIISEARIRLDRWNIPAGMVGLGAAPGSVKDAPTLTMVARDFLGAEIDRIILKLDPNAPEDKISMTPTGPSSFELRIGKYMIAGMHR